MGAIVTGNALPFSENPCHEDDGKIFHLPVAGDPPNTDAQLPAFDQPFLFGHRGKLSHVGIDENHVPSALTLKSSLTRAASEL